MRTISRRILGELLRNFVLALALMTGSLLFEKLYRVIKTIPDLPLVLVGRLVVLLMPSFFPMGIPMAVLVAVLLLYGRMAMDGELVALKALGMGPVRFARPALRFSLLCGLIALLCAHLLGPQSRRVFRETVTAAVPEAVRVDEGVITEAFPGTLLFVGEKSSERSFRRVFLFRERDEEIPAVAIAAEEGTLSFDESSRELRFLLQNGQIHRGDEETDVLLEFGSYDMVLPLPSVKAGRKREEMGTGELYAAAGREPETKARAKLLLEVHRRFSWPAACVVFCLIGIPLGSLSGRSGRFGGFFAALAVLSGYYYLLILMESMALNGTLDPALGVWLPNMIFTGAGVALFRFRRGLP